MEPLNFSNEIYTADIPVSKATAVIDRMLKENSGMYEDGDLRHDIAEFIYNFLNQKSHPGDADDFHNFAVTLAKEDEYIWACSILECGMNYFPKNVDLLSDFLIYAMSANDINHREDFKTKCEHYYKTLLTIPVRLWTWRGFSFSISYILQNKKDTISSDEEFDSLVKELVNIAHNYRKLFPNSEDTYRTEAIIYKELNMQSEQRAILEEALKKVNACPKCAIMYADIAFAEGDYVKALECIRRAIADSNQIQNFVRDGYLYFMAGMCKIAVAQKNNSPLNEEEIMDIYTDFNIALPFFSNEGNESDDKKYISIIENKTTYLLGKYHITIPERFIDLQKYNRNEND